MTSAKNKSSEKITIVRKAKKNNYSIISNLPVRDPNLSWKAKGLLWYLLQLPDDWKINTSHLEKQASDGRHSLKEGLKELQKSGYLTHENIREKGRFTGHLWTVYEEPIYIDIDCKEPQAENPLAENQDAENQPLLITKDSLLKTKENVGTGVPLSADADDLLSFFIQKLEERKPDIKLPESPKRWLLEIERMIRIDNRDPKKIKAMIDWIHRDPFWSMNILSPEKLRKQYDQIELQALGKHKQTNIQKNKEYALRLKQKYPETYKNFSISSAFVSHQGTGKELSLNLPHENFKKSFVHMFGGEYNERD